jgi:tetratricopeptide (TPR) repeat protein
MNTYKCQDKNNSDSNSNLSHTYFCKAYMLERESNYDEAVNLYYKSIGLDATNYLAFYNKANILFIQNNMKDSIEFYDRAISLNPNLYLAYSNKGDNNNESGKLQGRFTLLRSCFENQFLCN